MALSETVIYDLVAINTACDRLEELDSYLNCFVPIGRHHQNGVVPFYPLVPNAHNWASIVNDTKTHHLIGPRFSIP